MNCLFCDIANGKTDTDIIYQDDKFAVFRDIKPRAPIHLLIVPKKHMESIAEIAEKNDVEILGQILILASKIAKKFKVENGYRLQFNQGKKAGQEIDHLHLHLLGFK